jgi:PemK-like, MazF-like toxin of type II toxin-antitoxin system
VVVSSAAYHRERPDLILMAVTSQLRPSGAIGEVMVAQWREAGLLRPSAVKPVITTIHRRLVIRKLGRLRPRDRRAVTAALGDIVAAETRPGRSR